MTSAVAAAPRRRRLFVLQAVYAVFLPVWFALAIAATMGLANTDSLWAAPAILVVWLYPVAAVIAGAVSHAVWQRRPRQAQRWNLLPLPWVVVGAALLVWIFSSEFSFGP
jgi:hypothetical protein